jgi:hypothetical protein
MRISDGALDEFIAIYKEEFGEELSRADALEIASNLIMIYRCISRKLPDSYDSGKRVMPHDGVEALTP